MTRDSLIHAYGDVAEKGPKGNIPESEEQAGFALQRVYWSHFMIAIFCGIAMAFVQLAVINCAEEIPKRWTDNGEYNTADDCKLYQGEPYWICIGTVLLTLPHPYIHHTFIHSPALYSDPPLCFTAHCTMQWLARA